MFLIVADAMLAMEHENEGNFMPILNWLDHDKSLKAAARVPYRILVEDAALSYGDKNSPDMLSNMLIEGDNLHALKALMPYFRGAVKCIFIDPPYNTKSTF